MCFRRSSKPPGSGADAPADPRGPVLALRDLEPQSRGLRVARRDHRDRFGAARVSIRRPRSPSRARRWPSRRSVHLSSPLVAMGGDLAAPVFAGSASRVGGLVARRACCSLYPAYLAVQARTVPLVADISTDLGDPPTFHHDREGASPRGTATTPAAAMSPADRALQENRLYPDLQSRSRSTARRPTSRTSSTGCVKIVRRHHWTDRRRGRPAANFATGHIDIGREDLSVMGFPADRHHPHQADRRDQMPGRRPLGRARRLARAGLQRRAGPVALDQRHRRRQRAGGESGDQAFSRLREK